MKNEKDFRFYPRERVSKFLENIETKKVNEKEVEKDEEKKTNKKKTLSNKKK